MPYEGPLVILYQVQHRHSSYEAGGHDGESHCETVGLEQIASQDSPDGSRKKAQEKIEAEGCVLVLLGH